MPRVNPNKCSAEEFLIAARSMTDDLNHKVIQDESRKPRSVVSLFMMTWGYIPQETDKYKIDNDGNPSIKKWPIEHLVHNREAMGIEKGNLPNTTIFCPRTGAEIFPPITMNGIIIDINFSKVYSQNSRNRNISLFATS